MLLRICIITDPAVLKCKCSNMQTRPANADNLLEDARLCQDVCPSDASRLGNHRAVINTSFRLVFLPVRDGYSVQVVYFSYTLYILKGGG